MRMHLHRRMELEKLNYIFVLILNLFLYHLIYFIDICSIRLIIQRFTLKFEQNVFS